MQLTFIFSVINSATVNDRYVNVSDDMYKTTSKDNGIVQINSTQELKDFIWNFIEENSFEESEGDGGEMSESIDPEEKVVSGLETIKHKLSQFISSESARSPVPKSLRDEIETEDDVRETISKIVAEQQETIYQDQDNLDQQIQLIQEHLIEDYDSDGQLVEVFVNGDYAGQTMANVDELTTVENGEEPVIGPKNKVTWTLSAPQTPNAAIGPVSKDEYYDDYVEEDNLAEPSNNLAVPHLAASSALSNLNDLFKQHLPQQSDQPISPLSIINKLQQQSDQLPESETLNIILTPGHKNQPNIAILPTADLPQISSDISKDIGVDIEAILNSLAGSAAMIKNRPMIVEENHTQLIKQPGQPTTMKVKETMSEILGDSSNPKINVLKNKEEQNSFHDLESLIRQVTGETVQELPQDIPKGSLDLNEQLKLNVSTRTNIVNIFAFNIYPSQGGLPHHNYQVNEFSNVGTSIQTHANVLFQPPGEAPTQIESQYDFQSKPTSQPAKKANMIDKILGAVLLSQLEGGGSDRVIAALGQSPEMMSLLIKDSQPTPAPAPAIMSGLYPQGVDNLSEYSPGPYGTIARNKELEKLILAMTQAEQQSSQSQSMTNIMNDMPDYAKLLLKKNPQQLRQRSDGPLGPLGFSVNSGNDESSSSSNNNVVKSTKPEDILQSMGGGAAAALMAGAVVTVPYWMPLLAGRRRKREAVRLSRDSDPDISRDWLALLTGSKYTSSDNLEKRLHNWVEPKPDKKEKTPSKKPLEEEKLLSTSITVKDDIFTNRDIKEKVRVSLTEEDSKTINEWREQYTNKEEPNLYNTYYPLKDNEVIPLGSTTTKSTTLKPASTTTTTTSSTTRSSTSTTQGHTLPDSLLFWTTVRPAFSRRKTTLTTSSSPVSTTQLTTSSLKTTKSPKTTEPSTISTTTIVESKIPTSGFMWFTKKPKYNLDSNTTSSPSAWWKQQRPSTFVKLSSNLPPSKAVTATLRPNFSNNYQYNQPITRTPAQKQSWKEKFSPVQVSPLYETETELIIDNRSPAQSQFESQTKDFLLIDDVAPKSSIVNQKEKTILATLTKESSGKIGQKEVDLPKWPYVENLWNKVDKIMGDLLEPEDLKTNKISNIDNILTSLSLDTKAKNQLENEALYNSLNTGPTTTTIPSTSTSRPDQAYWQNLKKKHGFISAYTEYYPSESTEKPQPAFYNAQPFLPNEIILETEIQSVTQPGVVEGASNSLYFDDNNQPPSQPYVNNPSILVAKRNISSTSDVLVYLNELMKGSNDRREKDTSSERGTTMRSFFSPDLLSKSSFSPNFPHSQAGDSLGNTKNFLHLNKFQLNFDSLPFKKFLQVKSFLT